MKTAEQQISRGAVYGLYKVVLTFKYFVEIVFSMTIQMEATWQYFPMMCSTLYYERWFLLSLHGIPLKRLFVKQFSESSELHRSCLVGVD